LTGHGFFIFTVRDSVKIIFLYPFQAGNIPFKALPRPYHLRSLAAFYRLKQYPNPVQAGPSQDQPKAKGWIREVPGLWTKRFILLFRGGKPECRIPTAILPLL
jgi:hypothetical protein